MKLYPILASLSQRAVLVVGGGPVAECKVTAMLDGQAHVTVNPDKLETPDWTALAQERQRLVIDMGVGELGTRHSTLVEHGRAASTPFVLIENGFRADQRVVIGVLDNLVERATTHAVRSPALLILGEVAALARSLAWFGAPPLRASVHELQAGTPTAAETLGVASRVGLLEAIHRMAC